MVIIFFLSRIIEIKRFLMSWRSRFYLQNNFLLFKVQEKMVSLVMCVVTLVYHVSVWVLQVLIICLIYFKHLSYVILVGSLGVDAPKVNRRCHSEIHQSCAKTPVV